ncbi:MAG: hypothetical protein V3R91_03275 [Myxococcota bacterium]
MTLATRASLAFLGMLLLCLPGCNRPDGVGGERLVKAFEPGRDLPIQRSAVSVTGEAWRVNPDSAGSVRLFEIANPGLESVVLGYRAQLRAEDVRAAAYLEMWVRLPGRGTFFSKGVANPLRGTSEWASYEIPFLLKAGEAPDLIQLNIAFEEPGGAVYMREVALVAVPLAGS